MSAQTLDALDCRGYLKRDRATGLKVLDARSFQVFLEAEHYTDWFYEIGEDGDGPNQVVCNCDECRDRTDLNDSRISPVRPEQIVAEVRAHRAAQCLPHH